MKNISEATAKKLIPKRLKISNKTTYGKTLIIGGDKNLIGAAIMSALAATKSGSGYIYLMSDLKKFDLLKFPDFILYNFSIKNLKNKNQFSVGIGPGLGTDALKKRIFVYLLKNNFNKVVVDADALTLLSKMKNIKLPASWILTPHEGEMLRLLNIKAEVTQKNRVELAKMLQMKFGCHILLKGPENIFISPTGECAKASFGDVSLAKAGTGDVLTGIIAAHLNYKLTVFEAMIVSSYIHGKAAKNYIKKGYSVKSLRPIDLIEEVAKVV